MATEKKSTRREKIAESFKNLPIVSTKVKAAEDAIELTELMASQVENEDVRKFILDSAELHRESIARYNADVVFLRKQIMYHTSKIVEEMTVMQFAKFGKNLMEGIATKSVE